MTRAQQQDKTHCTLNIYESKASQRDLMLCSKS